MMNHLTYCSLGIALALDCFSVSLSCGILQRQMGRQVWVMAALFGLFQGTMAMLGWAVGDLLDGGVFLYYNKWISCILLCLLGGRMMWEGFSKETGSARLCADPSRLGVLLTLSVATSIDALVVGFSLTGMGIISLATAVVPTLWIASVSFLLTFAGKYLGVRLGHHLNLPAAPLAGIILILIGIKAVM